MGTNGCVNLLINPVSEFRYERQPLEIDNLRLRLGNSYSLPSAIYET